MAFNLGTSGNSNKLNMKDFLGSNSDVPVTEKEIDIDLLVPWENQPFKRYGEYQLSELANSIKENGLLSPIIVCPIHDDENKYRIIAGHNRVEACRKIGMTTIPSIIKDVDENRAKLMMVDTNLCQRLDFLPSEKAYAYKAQQEALQALGSNRTTADIAEKYKENRRTVQMYIACARLVPELMDLLDSGKLLFAAAYSLSNLAPKIQETIGILLKENNLKIGKVEAETLAHTFKDKEHVKSSEILEFLTSDKKSASSSQSKRITLSRKEIVGIIGDELSNEEISEYLFFCLQHEELFEEWRQMVDNDESDSHEM